MVKTDDPITNAYRHVEECCLREQEAARIKRELLAKIASGEQLNGGEITYLAWEAFGEWLHEQCTLDDEDYPDRVTYDRACVEAYSQACDNGWLPSWERIKP